MVGNLQVALPIITNIASVSDRANDLPGQGVEIPIPSGQKRRTEADLEGTDPVPGSRNSDDRRLDTHIALQKLDLLKHTAGLVAQNDTSVVSRGFAMRNDNIGLEPTAS